MTEGEGWENQERPPVVSERDAAFRQSKRRAETDPSQPDSSGRRPGGFLGAAVILVIAIGLLATVGVVQLSFGASGVFVRLLGALIGLLGLWMALGARGRIGPLDRPGGAVFFLRVVGVVLLLVGLYLLFKNIRSR